MKHEAECLVREKQCMVAAGRVLKLRELHNALKLSWISHEDSGLKLTGESRGDGGAGQAAGEAMPASKLLEESIWAQMDGW